MTEHQTIAWQYVPPSIKRVVLTGIFTKKQLKSIAQYVYLYRMGWVLWAPGTNLVKMEKVDRSFNAKSVQSMASFPIERVSKKSRRVLEDALIREIPLKYLVKSDKKRSNVARIRRGKRALLKALDEFGLY